MTAGFRLQNAKLVPMRKGYSMKFMLGCLFSIFTFSAFAADVRMLTDIHPPLQLIQGDELVGFGVDLVKAVAEQTGDKVHIDQLPWLRALRVASAEPDTGVFTILRTPEREAEYQWVGPLIEVETALYAGSRVKEPVQNLKQASVAEKIALPRKWLAYDYLKKQGFANLYGVDTPEQMMRLLRMGRTDLVVADTISFSSLAHEAGMDRSDLRYQMPLMKQGAYIAFSLQTDAHLISRWQRALDKMKRDGQLNRLKERWLSDHTMP